MSDTSSEAIKEAAAKRLLTAEEMTAVIRRPGHKEAIRNLQELSTGVAAALGQVAESVGNTEDLSIQVINDLASKLRVARAALREIEGGSGDKGRWIIQGGPGEAAEGGVDEDGEKGDPPEGCYDVEAPPEGTPPAASKDEALYKSDGMTYDYPVFRPGTAEELVPAAWEPYTEEENQRWLDGVSDIARRGLRESTPGSIDLADGEK